MTDNQYYDILKDQHLFDSSKLLDTYFNNLKSLQDKIKLAVDKTKSCNNYINNLSEYLNPFIDYEINSINDKTLAYNNQIETIKRNFFSASTPVERYNSENELKELELKFNLDYERFKDLSKALDETLEILKPVVNNIENIQRVAQKQKYKFRRLTLKKFTWTVVLIAILACVFTYALDHLQSLIEIRLQVSHFTILLLSFLLQTFVIDPLILNKIKSKINWEFIYKIQIEIPQVETQFELEKEKFNDIVTQWKQLFEFKI